MLWYGTNFSHKGHSRIHSKLRKVLGVEVDDYFKVVRQDLKWELNPADFTQREFFWTGDKDHWEMHHIRQIVNPGDVVIDIGANFGYYALLLAKLVGTHGEVHAIEPQGTVFERLSTHIEINELENCVRPYNLGFSDRPGFGKLVVRPENSGATWIDTESRDGETELTTFDKFCSAQGIDDIAFVKIDIEGAEEKLLLGGKERISKVPVMLIEVNPNQLEKSSTSSEKLIDLLKSYGFDLFEIKREKLIPLAHVPSGPNYKNIFCRR